MWGAPRDELLRERPNRPRADPWGESRRHATRALVPARLGLSLALILTNAHRRSNVAARAVERARAREELWQGWRTCWHTLCPLTAARGATAPPYSLGINGDGLHGIHFRGRPAVSSGCNQLQVLCRKPIAKLAGGAISHLPDRPEQFRRTAGSWILTGAVPENGSCVDLLVGMGVSSGHFQLPGPVPVLSILLKKG